MSAHRTAYIAIFLVASLVAAAVYYLAQPRAEAVRARTDIPIFAPITADMVELVQVPPAARPANAAISTDDVVGRYAAMPILAGQYVDTRALESTPGERTFGFGAAVPPGHVAFALPVEPAQAVGGALSPGARVEVVAVPNALVNEPPTAEDGTDAGAVTLGEDVLVLALRTADGQALREQAADAGRTTMLPPRLGSVVVAVPAADLPRYASAVLTSTVYLALNPQPADAEAAE